MTTHTHIHVHLTIFKYTFPFEIAKNPSFHSTHLRLQRLEISRMFELLGICVDIVCSLWQHRYIKIRS